MENFEEYLRKNKAGLDQLEPEGSVRERILGALAAKRAGRKWMQYGIAASCILCMLFAGVIYVNQRRHFNVAGQLSGKTAAAESNKATPAPGVSPRGLNPLTTLNTNIAPPSSGTVHLHVRKDTKRRLMHEDNILAGYKELVSGKMKLIRQTGVHFISHEDYVQFIDQYRESLMQVGDIEQRLLREDSTHFGKKAPPVFLSRLYGQRLALLDEMYERMKFINSRMSVIGMKPSEKVYFLKI